VTEKGKKVLGGNRMGWEGLGGARRGLGGSGTRPTELVIYSSQVATEALTALREFYQSS
jgi:hypothetical protein